MPHFKSFLRYALRVEPSGDGHGIGGKGVMVPRLSWCLVGSHNYSKSAWGQLQKKVFVVVCVCVCVRVVVVIIIL